MTRSSDEILRDTIERGEFQNLPWQGKKLVLDNYFDAPEEVRQGFTLLKSNDFLSQEVQLRKDIEALQKTLKQTPIEEERRHLQQEIEARRLKYNLPMERFHRRCERRLFGLEVKTAT